MHKIILSVLLIGSFLFANGGDESKFTLTTTDNKEIHIQGTKVGLDIQEYKDSVVFLVLFGHECPPCLKEIPEYITLKDKYQDKLNILGIEVQKYNIAQLKEFKKDKNINYDIVSGEENSNFIGYIIDRAGWHGEIPLIIMIDPKGEVQDIRSGFVPIDILEKFIKKYQK